MTDIHHNQTRDEAPKFDADAYPPHSLIHERRSGRDRRLRASATPPVARERRTRRDRRRRVDPTTFEKQYSEDELEFMNAIQQFKVQMGKPFPSHGEVLRVAMDLGYRKVDAQSLGASNTETSSENPSAPVR